MSKFWDAVHEYVAACGGSADEASLAKQQAVAKIEKTRYLARNEDGVMEGEIVLRLHVQNVPGVPSTGSIYIHDTEKALEPAIISRMFEIVKNVSHVQASLHPEALAKLPLEVLNAALIGSMVCGEDGEGNPFFYPAAIPFDIALRAYKDAMAQIMKPEGTC